MNSSQSNIILFDGVCNLCSKTVKFIIRKDSKSIFRFASLQSEKAQLLLGHFKFSPDSLNTLVYIEDNRCFLKSTAVLKILQNLGGGWQLLYPLIIIPRFIRDMVYDFIAKHRYKCFGKNETCIVPLPEYKDRFLE